jgi:hypothetical protein
MVYLITVGVFYVLLVVTIAFVLYKAKKHKKEVQDTITSLRYEITGLFNASADLGDRLRKLEGKLSTLAEIQDRMVNSEENGGQTYQSALHLLQCGESPDKIAETCGISRGEIDMLAALSRISGEQKQNA